MQSRIVWRGFGEFLGANARHQRFVGIHASAPSFWRHPSASVIAGRSRASHAAPGLFRAEALTMTGGSKLPVRFLACLCAPAKAAAAGFPGALPAERAGYFRGRLSSVPLPHSAKVSRGREGQNCLEALASPRQRGAVPFERHIAHLFLSDAQSAIRGELSVWRSAALERA